MASFPAASSDPVKTIKDIPALANLLLSIIKKFRCLLRRCITTGSERQGLYHPLKDGDCTVRKASSPSGIVPSFYPCQSYRCPEGAEMEPFLACTLPGCKTSSSCWNQVNHIETKGFGKAINSTSSLSPTRCAHSHVQASVLIESQRRSCQIS